MNENKICEICSQPPAALTEIPGDKFWPKLKNSKSLYLCNEHTDILQDLGQCKICGGFPAKIVEIPREYFTPSKNGSKFFLVCIECIKDNECPLCRATDEYDRVMHFGETKSTEEPCRLCNGSGKFDYSQIAN